MNIELKKIDINDSKTIDSYLKWENDQNLTHLIIPIRSKDQEKHKTTKESILEFFKNHPDRQEMTYIIYDNETAIGNVNYYIDPPHLHKKINNTAWIGLTIGEKDYWGTGAAFEAMTLLEEIFASKKIKRMELGVFEFNTRAIKFYEKLGFKKIGEIKNFTYWDDRFWNDIRMEKNL
ncbi:MAG: GNAT family N-acetyltransferase [Halobacteriovorax sp.]|nr:GNAT family N-acetyltransferase [Halobacteriovorax sp.]|tara:strand:- start:258 stop:788 length:531 start_codon:yes stop_codon:yes gene_type:complete